MTSIGVAESFYGEMYGNEGRLTPQHLIVRKADGELWVGSYRRDESGKLIPHYGRQLKTGEERFTVPLAKQVELQEPSLLITYGEKFLALLEQSKAFSELFTRLSSLPRVSEDYYEGFRGYIGTQLELEEMNGAISVVSRKRLEDFFSAGDLRDTTSVTKFYELWKSATTGIFSTSENLALDTACRILAHGEEERDYLSWVEIHCKHHEEADYHETIHLLEELIPLRKIAS